MNMRTVLRSILEMNSSRTCCRSFTRVLRRGTIMIVVLLNILSSPALGEVAIIHPTTDEVTVTLGQTLSMQCVSTDGRPVKWSSAGRMFADDGDAIRTHTDTLGRLISTLTLREVSDVDEGRYQCSNEYFDRDELMVKVHTSAPPQTVKIVEPDGDELRTPMDRRFTLKCVGEEGSSIRWLHNGFSLHNTGSRMIITTSLGVDDFKVTSLLTRLHVTSTESGQYTCQDDNNRRSSDSVQVIVSETREDSVPVQLVQPSSSTLAVDLGASFTLQCRGDSRANLNWFINDTMLSLLSNPPKVDRMEEEGATTITLLTIDESTYADSGHYSCRNGMDPDDRDDVSVTVRHPDDVEEEPDVPPTQLHREVLRVGSNMKLRCSLKTSSEHVTVWYKDDRRLVSQGKYAIKEAGGAELDILHTDRTDVGVYRCTFVCKETGNVLGNILFNLTTIPCQSLSPPQNGTLLSCPDEPLYGDSCTFQCNKGFKLTDKRPVVCEHYVGPGHYIWNRATPKCIGGDLYDSTPEVTNSATHVILARQWEVAIRLILVVFILLCDA